jgi:hypothetical protein
MRTRTTKVEAALAAAEEEHANDPERAEVLRRARTFKSSWLELAEALMDVRRSKRWEQWGYDTFEAYAKNELHLRMETVDKLTGSFAFLQKRAPEVLERDGVRAQIPTYQAVDFLRRAEAAEDAPEEAVSEVRRRVLEEVAPLPSVAKEFKEVVLPTPPEERKKRDVAGLKNVAGRLRELLRETDVVPRRVAGEVAAALEQLLATLSDLSEKTKEEAA